MYEIKKYLSNNFIFGSEMGGIFFGYVPILALGGKETVEQMKKVKIREHIALITELTGGV